MEEEKEKKYTGRGGYHGGGRKKTGRQKIYVNTTISGLPDEINALKALAKKSGKTLSRFVIETFLRTK
jgi:hypothetical protein